MVCVERGVLNALLLHDVGVKLNRVIHEELEQINGSDKFSEQLSLSPEF